MFNGRAGLVGTRDEARHVRAQLSEPRYVGEREHGRQRCAPPRTLRTAPALHKVGEEHLSVFRGHALQLCNVKPTRGEHNASKWAKPCRRRTYLAQ